MCWSAINHLERVLVVMVPWRRVMENARVPGVDCRRARSRESPVVASQLCVWLIIWSSCFLLRVCSAVGPWRAPPPFILHVLVVPNQLMWC